MYLCNKIICINIFLSFLQEAQEGLRLTHFNAAPSILLAFRAAGTSSVFPQNPGHGMNTNMTWLLIGCSNGKL